MGEMMKKPVAFIIFNRLDTAQIVFDEIRKYAPKQLFVIADGPRANKENEEQLCQETRDVIKVDWPCEVTYIYSDKNLGCQQRIYTGLNEVFNNVEEAIILEDDCVPHESFFTYCEDLLTYYKDNDKVMAISGNNFQAEDFRIEESYYFSIYPHCWGWATWKRAWSKMDVKMNGWQEFKRSKAFKNLCYDCFFEEYWSGIFEAVKSKKINSWAYPWTYSCWVNEGLTILPRKNLVSNIGFNMRGTHTINSSDKLANLPVYKMEFPLKRPNKITVNFQADVYSSEHHFNLANKKEKTLIEKEKLDFLIKNIENHQFKDINKQLYLFGAGKWSIIVEDILNRQGKKVLNYLVTTKVDESPNIKQTNEVEFIDSSIVIVCIEGYHDKEIVNNLRKQFENQAVEIYSWRDFN